MTAEQSGDLTAGMLAARTPALNERTTCGEVYDWFIAHPAVPAAAILGSRTGGVLGLINRFIFFASYAKQYVPELFSRKSVLKLANQSPLVVDAEVRLADLGATLLVENPDALIECFVVTRRGRYLGVGTGEALLQGKVKLLQAREQELSRALQAETRANAAKSDFLALMSHELRTPLNAIIGFSEIMAAQGLGPVGNEQYLGYIKDINASGVHLLAIINDILDLSKAEAGKLEMREDVADLRQLIGAALKMVQARAESSGVVLVSEIPAELPYLLCDERKLKQVLLNLLSNGIKFTPSGGKVAVSVARRDGELVIAISDSGIGIASTDIAKAFEPFGQVDNRLSRKYDGTGLGLPLAAAMIDQHGGRLTLTSEVGSGTTASIVIPAQRLLPAIQATA